jgi:hypothetical protein
MFCNCCTQLSAQQSQSIPYRVWLRHSAGEEGDRESVADPAGDATEDGAAAEGGAGAAEEAGNSRAEPRPKAKGRAKAKGKAKGRCKAEAKPKIPKIEKCAEQKLAEKSAAAATKFDKSSFTGMLTTEDDSEIERPWIYDAICAIDHAFLAAQNMFPGARFVKQLDCRLLNMGLICVQILF